MRGAATSEQEQTTSHLTVVAAAFEKSAAQLGRTDIPRTVSYTLSFVRKNKNSEFIFFWRCQNVAQIPNWYWLETIGLTSNLFTSFDFRVTFRAVILCYQSKTSNVSGCTSFICTTPPHTQTLFRQYRTSSIHWRVFNNGIRVCYKKMSQSKFATPNKQLYMYLSVVCPTYNTWDLMKSRRGITNETSLHTNLRIMHPPLYISHTNTNIPYHRQYMIGRCECLWNAKTFPKDI